MKDTDLRNYYCAELNVKVIKKNKLYSELKSNFISE